MRIYKTMAVVLLCSLSLILSGSTADSATSEISLSKILSDESIEAITYLNSDGNTFLVVVTSYGKILNNEKLTGRKLIVYKKQNSAFLKVFEYDAGLDHFVGMFPLADYNGNLITMWIGGSAYHFNVFNLSNGKVISVLETGSHIFPEFIDIDNDGQLEFMISEGSLLVDAKTKKIISYPEKAKVYKWDGKSYMLIKTVPWKARLNFLISEK